VLSGVMSVSSASRSDCGWEQVSLPSLKLAFAAQRLLADVSVSLECYRTEVLSVRKGAERAG